MNAGVFKDVDVSYMIHPMTGTSMVTCNFLAVSGIEIVFKVRRLTRRRTPTTV